MLEDFGEIRCELGVLEEEARVAVQRYALLGPVLAADENALAIDHHAFGMAVLLHADVSHIEAEVLQSFQIGSRIRLVEDSKDDAHLYASLLLCKHCRQQLFELGLIVPRGIEGLVLDVQLLLGAVDQRQNKVEEIIRGEQWLDVKDALLVQRLEILERCRS